MMKKLTALLLCLLMLLTGAALAADSEQRVFDNADLFTAEQEQQLEDQIAAFRQKYNMDFVILTNKDPYSNSTSQDYADTYYEKGGFGVGSDHSGALFLIDMYDSAYNISTTGEAMDYLTDERLESFKSRIQSALRSSRSSGDYYSSASKALSLFEGYVKQGIPEGQYRYDVLTGKQLTARHKALTPMEILISVAIAAVAGLAVFLTTHGTYSLKHSTYHYDYKANSDVEITGSRDDFVRTDHIRSPRIEVRSGGGPGGGGGGHSGGSGVHRSSGGGMHGGGGGHF